MGLQILINNVPTYCKYRGGRINLSIPTRLHVRSLFRPYSLRNFSGPQESLGHLSVATETAVGVPYPRRPCKPLTPTLLRCTYSRVSTLVRPTFSTEGFRIVNFDYHKTSKTVINGK